MTTNKPTANNTDYQQRECSHWEELEIDLTKSS